MIDKKTSFKIFAGWLIDGTGAPAVRNAIVEISSGIIRSVRSVKKHSEVSGITLDLPQHTILPGLIDSHVHLFMSGDIDEELRRLQLESGYKDAERTISRHLREHLTHGIVGVRDGGDRKGHSFQYKKEYSEGVASKVDFKVAGKAWHAKGRYGKLIGRSPGIDQDLGQAIMKNMGGIDHIKIVNSGLNSLIDFARETPPQYSREQLAEVVLIAGEAGLKVMVHANGRLAVKGAIEAGCHSIEHGFFMGRDNLSLMADKGVSWVPTAFTMKAYSDIFSGETRECDIAKRNLEHQIEQIAIAREYGVKISVGTDSGSPGVHHGKAVRKEIEILVSAGYSIERAIQCVTLNNAELLGSDVYSGSLIPGKEATFITVPCAPEDLTESMVNIDDLFLKGLRINTISDNSIPDMS